MNIFTSLSRFNEIFNRKKYLNFDKKKNVSCIGLCTRNKSINLISPAVTGREMQAKLQGVTKKLLLEQNRAILEINRSMDKNIHHIRFPFENLFSQNVN